MGQKMKMSGLNCLRIAALACGIAVVGGCVTPPVIDVEENTPGVRSAIDKAVERVDKHKAATKEAAEPAVLGGRITVIWEGEAAEILSRIAAAQKLDFKITGPQPRLHLPVFIKLNNVTLPEALTAIGDQFGQRANIELFDDRIELRMRMY